MPKKSNTDITTSYEKSPEFSVFKVSDFDTVVSENEHFEVHSKAFSEKKKGPATRSP